MKKIKLYFSGVLSSFTQHYCDFQEVNYKYTSFKDTKQQLYQILQSVIVTFFVNYAAAAILVSASDLLEFLFTKFIFLN